MYWGVLIWKAGQVSAANRSSWAHASRYFTLSHTSVPTPIEPSTGEGEGSVV
jgi:hypothetical protein